MLEESVIVNADVGRWATDHGKIFQEVLTRLPCEFQQKKLGAVLTIVEYLEFALCASVAGLRIT